MRGSDEVMKEWGMKGAVNSNETTESNVAFM